MFLKETKKKQSSFKKYIKKITLSKRLKKIKRNLKNNKLLKDNNKIEEKNEINDNQKIIKKRNAGVDLLSKNCNYVRGNLYPYFRWEGTIYVFSI